MAKGHFGDAAFTASSGIPRFFDLPMLKPQVRVILRNCGLIDPEDIDHYLAQDGYVGLINALTSPPQSHHRRNAGIRPARPGRGWLSHL